MKTLIIAAGDGTRLAEYTKNYPKPLLKILGKSILEIILENSKKAGLKDFVIVTGFLGRKIRKAVQKFKFNSVFVNNPNFQKENGCSVYAAKKILQKEKNFLLLVADHIFDANILKKLLKYKIKAGCAVCIDKNLKKIPDLKTATKVYERNNKIFNIGKKLKNYNGVDAGFFLCTPDIFKALKKSIKKGFDELSDSMKLLAKQRKLFSIDISGNFWLDIDTKRDLEYAKRIWPKIKKYDKI